MPVDLVRRHRTHDFPGIETLFDIIEAETDGKKVRIQQY